MASWKFSDLSRAEQVTVGASAVMLLALFLPWYGVSVASYSASVSGWGSGYGLLGGLLVVAAGVYLVLRRSGVEGLAKPSPAVTMLVASALGTLVVVLRLLGMPSEHVALAGVSVLDDGPRFGIWLALVAGIAETVALVKVFRASGEDLPWSKG
ncbi:MAG: hypothetical protein M0T80_01620 [Actinomycetota bacterium]|nr:hypothetical protein [Actinomycetota bacterium]